MIYFMVLISYKQILQNNYFLICRTQNKFKIIQMKRFAGNDLNKDNHQMEEDDEERVFNLILGHLFNSL